MFGISKHEIMQKLVVKATEMMVKDDVVKLPGFGTIWFNTQDKTFKFEPDNLLLKALRTAGKY